MKKKKSEGENVNSELLTDKLIYPKTQEESQAADICVSDHMNHGTPSYVN